MTTAANHYRDAGFEFHNAYEARERGHQEQAAFRMRMSEWHQRQAGLRIDALRLLAESETSYAGILRTEQDALARLLADEHSGLPD
ncbi:hypothetical protein H0B56_02280 [Haloechinothrix sp. YIM 98757]|uniref:Uncharacterized protein n=1 Tax=Haloechinothrix aidingensis TaxID=2752311 RepID=A0A837ZW81_9PSEU|nr:hypothetical protein [Haloechinothrix aidingensis]MBA0124364.1 hypothetical protein [Haloechinothrix aidingensis]